MGTSRPRRSLDAVAGGRVAGVIGALLGALVAAVVGTGSAWLIFVGGAVGGAVGYWSQTRRTRRG